MALNPHFGLACREAALDNGLNLANSGSLVIYSGTQPTTCDTALSGNTALATFPLGATAFGASSGSLAGIVTKTMNAVAAVVASNTGTATWFRIYKSDAATGVADGSVGLAMADCIINNTTINTGGQVSIVSCAYTFSA